jgi:hypothetical protein
MEHDEFVDRSSSKAFVWGVRRVTSAVFEVWGAAGLAAYGLACGLAMAPPLALAAWSAMQGRYAAVAWIVPAAFAYLAARPRLNLVDASPWLACALAGLVLSLWWGPLHLLGGAAVVASWILAGTVRGITMAFLEGRLRSSKVAYERLRATGNLILTQRPPARG